MRVRRRSGEGGAASAVARRRRRPAVLAAVAASLGALTLAGCGGGDDPGREADGSAPGVLRVEQTPPEPLYTEGAVSHLTLTREGMGTPVVDGPLTDEATPSGTVLTRRVAPGGYRIETWQRPCEGNCRGLDPPTDRCEAGIRVHPGGRTTVTVRLGPPDDRCEMDVSVEG